MKDNDWIYDPVLKNIPQEKLHFLNALINASHSLTQKEMLPFLIAFEKKRKESNISFEHSELDCIIQAIRNHSTPEDLKMLELLKLLTP